MAHASATALTFGFLLIFLMVTDEASSSTTNELLDKCISSKNHKNTPGPEGNALAAIDCQAWNSKSCCTWNTTSLIDRDGTLSLYGIIWDQCPQMSKMSDKCKRHFQRDTCFYECSPNLGPWIEVDPVSQVQRKERMKNVPLCASDCIAWYDDCLFDYTCNDNWGKNWDWSKKGTPGMCKKPCKTFAEYFPDPKVFCEKLFNYSFEYESDELNCMNLVPVGSKNINFAIKAATEKANKKNSDSAIKSTFKSMLMLIGLHICRFNFM